MCKHGDKRRFFSTPISAQMSRCMCLCVCVRVVHSSFHQDFCPNIYMAAQQRKKRPASWNSLLSLRPLPVLLDICIRHSFESQHRHIKVFSVPLNPTLGEKCVPRRHWGPNRKGEKTFKTNKREENCEAAFFSSSFEALILLLCAWTVLVYSLSGSALWILANYAYFC